MTQTLTDDTGAPRGELKRSVGFYGLMFVSLGSIIGSGWLLGALNAAKVAGPASILSWLLAVVMLSLLALVYAELGAAYPVAGGAGRFPYYSHGTLAGFIAGWAAWLPAVFTAPIEVLAALTYLNSVSAVHRHFNMLTADGLLTSRGLVVAVVLMVAFTTMNLAGAKFLGDSNSVVVIWKTAVPLLAIGVVGALQFKTGNFTAGGGFMPYGFHGVFAALTGGVVFALQGFEQAVQLAGEARNPKKDLSRAVLTAMAIGATIYTLLQVVMIGALDPKNLAQGWANPLGTVGDFGAWYTLALAVGAGWLAKVLIIDAVISPAGTAICYVGTSARLAYSLGQEPETPKALAKTNDRGVPYVAIIVVAVLGILAFGPFKSWASLVNVVTGATAIMYGDRKRSYRVPMPKFVLPASFCSANLIIYWGGFDYTWKLVLAMAVGLVLFTIGAARVGTRIGDSVGTAIWIAPWLLGQVAIGAMGRYGDGATNILPNWIDLLVVIVFSLVIFFWAVRLTLSQEQTQEAVARDAKQLDYEMATA